MSSSPTRILTRSHPEIYKHNLKKEKKIQTICENFNLIPIEDFLKLMYKLI